MLWQWHIYRNCSRHSTYHIFCCQFTCERISISLSFIQMFFGLMLCKWVHSNCISNQDQSNECIRKTGRASWWFESWAMTKWFLANNNIRIDGAKWMWLLLIGNSQYSCISITQTPMLNGWFIEQKLYGEPKYEKNSIMKYS